MGELNLAQKTDAVFRQDTRVDDSRMLKNLLEKTYPADCLGLGPSGSPVSAIFAQITL